MNFQWELLGMPTITHPERANSCESESPANTYMHLSYSSLQSVSAGSHIPHRKWKQELAAVPSHASSQHVQPGQGGFCFLPCLVLELKPWASHLMKESLGQELWQKSYPMLGIQLYRTAVWAVEPHLGSSPHLWQFSSDFLLCTSYFVTASGENLWSLFLCR